MLTNRQGVVSELPASTFVRLSLISGLDLLAQELGNLGLSYDPPRGSSLTIEYEAIRAVYASLRIARDQHTNEEDYLAHRDILGILAGVGDATAKAVADACIEVILKLVEI